MKYAGIASRGLALAVDAAIAQGIVFVIGAVFALISSLVGQLELDTTGKVLAAVAWAVIVATYFIGFWTTAGKTPGMHLMGLRVLDSEGSHPGAVRATVRFVGLVLAIIPLCAGFLPVLVDDRRRALPDFMARTVVVYDTEPPPR